jgi:hypothetical protein
LVGISRDKDVEVQKKEIANVVRERISVEKSVASEEELIKDIRVTAQATREKEAMRISAEAEAQKSQVKLVKAAQAAEEAAKFASRERMVIAETELDTADKLARAKIRLAEGVQAEASAEGLAKARVREADTVAYEKQGLAEAKIELEKRQAEATGAEKQGLAKVRVREAEAAAIEKQGIAEATSIREKLVAEATGLAQKADSMKALDESGRAHEEYRLRIEMDKAVALETIRTRKDVVAAQAQVMAEAMSKAKINIVGGDGQFFDRFVNAVSLGQAVEGALGQSDTLRHLVNSVVSGNDDVGLATLVEGMMPSKKPSPKQPKDQG